MLSNTKSLINVSFPGGRSANGLDQAVVAVTLLDESGLAVEGAEVEIRVSPYLTDDSLTYTAGTVSDASGMVEASFTTKRASIKLFEVYVGGALVQGLIAKAEFLRSIGNFLVSDPFTENGPQTSDITLSGRRLVVKSESDNGGAITELTWDGEQLLNSRSKDRQLQNTLELDGFDEVGLAKLNQAGAAAELWGGGSSARYIDDISNSREALTQSFLSYNEPLVYGGATLECSGNILSNQLYLEYLGSPNIMKIGAGLNQFASTKRGAKHWGLNLALVQTFVKVFTYQPEVDSAPVEALVAQTSGTMLTTYAGGAIFTNAAEDVAIGVYRTPQSGAVLRTLVVKPGTIEVGDPKFTDNYAQFLDVESAVPGVGSSAGAHKTDRFVCVGTLTEVQGAFNQLFARFGEGSGSSVGAASIAVTAAPSVVQPLFGFNVELTAFTSAGDIAVDYNSPVTVTLLTGGVLSGLTTVLFQNGVATFNQLTLNTSGPNSLVFESGGLLTSVVVSVDNPIPVISTLSPDNALDSREVPLPLTVLGVGFSSASTVRFSGINLPTTYVSPSEVRTDIPANLLVENTYLVNVFSPAPGGGTSNSLRFAVTDGTAPTTSNQSISVSGSTVNIGWLTNEASKTDWIYVGPGGLTVESGDIPGYREAHSIALTNLATGDYSLFIRTEDVAGNTGTSNRLTFSVGDIVPPVISGIEITNISNSQATVTWLTNEPCTGVLTWTPQGGGSPVSRVLGISQSVFVLTLPGLTPGTVYDVDIDMVDSSQNPASASTSFTTTVTSDVTPPIITAGPVVSGLTQTSATITWTTNEAASSTVLYGTQIGVYTDSETLPGFAPEDVPRSVILTNLTPGTPYVYVAGGADPAGNTYRSNEFSFSTADAPSVGDLQVGEEVCVLELKVPKGLTAGSTYMAHATVPIAKATDLNLNWGVDGSVVQRTLATYKPQATLPTTSEQAFLEVGGLVVVELDDLGDGAGDWQKSIAFAGYTGTGYLEWTGPNLFNTPGVGTFGFSFVIETAGEYTLYIRNQHDDPDPTESNDAWVRMGSEPWEKVFSNGLGAFPANQPTNQWNWESRVGEPTEPQPQQTYNLQPGTHTLQFSGRSNGFRMDRVHLALGPYAEQDENAAQSPTTGVGGNLAGPNSVEIIFPTTVPVGVAEGQYFEKTLVATAAAAGGSLTISGTTGLNLAMSLPDQVDQTVDVLNPANLVVNKQGEHCVDYMYQNRLTSVVGDTLVVRTYVTEYDPAVDDTIYVRLLLANSYVDPTEDADGERYGVVGKIYFDELVIDSSGTGGLEVLPRFEKYCMNQVSPTNLKLIEFTNNANELEQAYHHSSSAFTHVNRSVAGVRSEIWPAQQQRNEHLCLVASGKTVDEIRFAREVLDFQNVAFPRSGRNWGRNVRWFGPIYARSGELADTYRVSFAYDHEAGVETNANQNASIVGGRAYDKMRQDTLGENLKYILEENVMPYRNSFGPGNIITSRWPAVHEFGCWTPGFSAKGTEGGVFMMHIYETDPGPGWTKGSTYWLDQVLERHWITQFDDTGALGAGDWYGADGVQKFLTRNTHNTNSRGLPPFFGYDKGLIGEQPRTFNAGICGYDGDILQPYTGTDGTVDNQFSWAWDSRAAYLSGLFDINGDPLVYTSVPGSYQKPLEGIGSTHIQRVLRPLLALTSSVFSPLYRDLLFAQCEMYLMAEDHKTETTYGQYSSRNVAQMLKLYENPSTQQLGGWLGSFGRNKGWAYFVPALYNMYLDGSETYSTGVSKKAHIREWAESAHEVYSRIMPGGNTPTYNTAQTHRRVVQQDGGSGFNYGSGKNDIGCIEYRFDQNFDGPFGYEFAQYNAEKFFTRRPSSSGSGKQNVVFIRDTANNEQTGTIGIYHSGSTGYSPGDTIEFYDRSAGSNSPALNTFNIVQVVSDYGDDYRAYQQMEHNIQLHSWYAMSKSIFSSYDPQRQNDFNLWAYEHGLASSQRGYYANNEDKPVPNHPDNSYGGIRKSAGYSPAGANSRNLPGGSIELVSPFLEEPQQAPFASQYFNDTQDSHVHYPQLCSAYAAEDLGIPGEALSLTALGIREAFRQGLGWDLPTWEAKLDVMAQGSWSGSTANVNERWHYYGCLAGEVQYQIAVANGEIGGPGGGVTSRAISWSITQTSVNEGAGPLTGYRVRTDDGLPVDTDVQFSISFSGTASPNDYMVSQGPYTILAGQTFADVPITINDDGVNQGNRTVGLSLGVVSGPATVGVGGTLTLTIIDDDNPVTPEATFMSGNLSLIEGGLAKVVRVSLTGSVSTPTNISIQAGGTAVVGTDYTENGLTVTGGSGRTLVVPANATQATFTVTALEDLTPDSGETIEYTLVAAAGYTIGSPDTVTIVIGEAGGPNSSEGRLNVEGIALGDGSANLSYSGPRTFFTTLPVNPPSQVLPEYYVTTDEAPAEQIAAQVIGLNRNSDDEWLSLQLCVTVDKPNGKQSVPGDATNPHITIKKGTGGVLHSRANQFFAFDLSTYEVEIKLANVTTPYVFRPGDPVGAGGLLFAPQVDYEGPYSRRTVYKGRFINPNKPVPSTRGREDECLIVKFVVEERTDVDAIRVDVIVENSALAPLVNPRSTNPDSDGTVYFDWIKLHTGNLTDSLVANTNRASIGVEAGSSSRSYWLVKPQVDIPDQGWAQTPATEEHGMLPGDSFTRRLVAFKSSIGSVIATQLAKRYDHGYVCGGLGFESGGWLDAGYHLPPFDQLAINFAGQSQMRAWNALGVTLEGTTVSQVENSTIRGVSSGRKHFGWAKPSGDANPGNSGETGLINAIGTRSFGFRAGNVSLLLCDAMQERHRLATFNTQTGKLFTDRNLIDAGLDSGIITSNVMPIGYTSSTKNKFFTCAWHWTNPSDSSSTSSSGSWALAPTDLPWNLNSSGKSTYYLSPTTASNNSFNWQFNYGGYWGPHHGTHSSRTHTGFRMAAYFLNDYASKQCIAHEGESKMMGISRFLNAPGNDPIMREDLGHSDHNVRHLENSQNNSYGDTVNKPLNRGYWWNSYNDSRLETGTPRGISHPSMSVAMHYSFADDEDRARITDGGNTNLATTHNWPLLLTNYIGRLVTPTGCIGILFKRGGSPFFQGTRENEQTWPNVPTRSGKLPGFWNVSTAFPTPTLNNPEGLHYGGSHGIHITYSHQMALTMRRTFPNLGTPYDPWTTMLGWSKWWSNSSDNFVTDDPYNAGQRGAWHYSAFWVASVGDQGADNPPLTPAAMENGDAFWYGMTQEIETGVGYLQREPTRFAFTATAYAMANGGYGDAAKGIARNYSRDGALDSDIYALALADLQNSVDDLSNGKLVYAFPVVGHMAWTGFGA